MATPRETLVNNALAQRGYKEGENNWTKYAADLNEAHFFSWSVQYQQWCAIFCQWVIYTTFFKIAETGALDPEENSDNCNKFISFARKKSINCAEWRKEFEESGNFINKNSSQLPQKGDLIFFDGHVGLVIEHDGTKVYTIEGNTSNMVEKRSYNKNDSWIIGYGILNWEALGDNSGVENGFSDADSLGPGNEPILEMVLTPPEILSAEIVSITKEYITLYIHVFSSDDTNLNIRYLLKNLDSQVELEILDVAEKLTDSQDGTIYYKLTFKMQDQNILPNTDYELIVEVSNTAGTAKQKINFSTPESYPQSVNKLAITIIDLENITDNSTIYINFSQPSDWGYWSSNKNSYLISFLVNGKVKATKEYLSTENNYQFRPIDFGINYTDIVQVIVQPFTRYTKNGVTATALCPNKAISNCICLRNNKYISSRFYMKKDNKMIRVAITNSIDQIDI